MKTRFLQGLLLCVALVGFVQADITPRIVGGEASSEAYPWMVSIQIRSGSQHFCGGTLIASHWVVTAAHCTDDVAAEQIQVVIGTTKLDESSTGETINVRAITNHESFDSSGKLENDISLLRLETNSTQTPISAISTADFSEIDSGDLLTAIGWGALEDFFGDFDNAEFPNELQEVQLPLVKPSTCRSVYSDIFTIFDDPLCAGYPQGGKDSCQGDSGGPLIIYKDETPYLVGVVSWGNGCAQAGFYGVYTNVSEYSDWLEQNMVTPVVDFELSQDSFYVGQEKTTTLPLTFTNFSENPITISAFTLQNRDEYLSLVDGDCVGRQLTFGDSCQIIGTVNIDQVGWIDPTITITAESTFNFDLIISSLEAVEISFMDELNIDWYSAGNSNSNWFVPEGNCQLRSGFIDNNEGTILMAHFTGSVAPKIDIEVSSELNSDGLLVYMDDNFTNLGYSGEATDQLTFEDLNLDDGDHRIRLVYTKNASESAGDDMAAITAVEFEDVLVSDDCTINGEPRTEPTPSTPESPVTGSGGGGAAFYLLLPLMLLSFRNSKVSHK